MPASGAAPFGYLPVSVHLRPAELALATADEAGARLRITAACGPTGAAGQVELVVPPELIAEPATALRYRLAPGEHAAFDVTVRPRPGAPAGRYFVAARIHDQLGQALEDVAALTLGHADPQHGSQPLLVTLQTPAVNLALGERGEILVRLENRARSEVRGEAQLVSPYGTWGTITPWTQGFAVEPAAARTLRYTVRAPATARPASHFWALVKVAYFGRLAYTQAIPVRYDDPKGSTHPSRAS